MRIPASSHRYFGGSSPYDGFDSETLQYLTLEQSAADLVNFARNVSFSLDTNQTSVATKAPWIYWGASYSATLGGWIEHSHPGVFHAYHLSSATVEANTDNWYYYDTIRMGIDAYRNDTNCTTALNEYVDSYLLAATPDANKTEAQKHFFGATYPMADDDFAYAIDTRCRYWQDGGGYKQILDMCDAVVGVHDTVQDPRLGHRPGLGRQLCRLLSHEFPRLDMHLLRRLDSGAKTDPLWCLDTHDLLNPFFEARTLGNPWRTRYWFLCNEPLASWGDGRLLLLTACMKKGHFQSIRRLRSCLSNQYEARCDTPLRSVGTKPCLKRPSTCTLVSPMIQYVESPGSD